MDFTINPKLEKLNSKIEASNTSLNEKLKNQETMLMSAITSIKADLSKDFNDNFNNHLKSYSQLNEKFNQKLVEINYIKTTFDDKYERLKLDLREFQDNYTQNINKNNQTIFDSIASLDKSTKRFFDNICFTIKDKTDGTSIKCCDPRGKTSEVFLKKLLPDDISIKATEENKLYWNYSFDNDIFNIDSNNKIHVTGLCLDDGKFIKASKINNDLNNATYNISSLTYKIEKVLNKLSTVNGYIASNNFNTKNPKQEALTEYALSCLSTFNDQLNESDLTAGTKIKNTYDNHIWILNKIKSIDGLYQNKWEDFGSDTICIAANNGVHGLVCGSQDKLKGYIDVKGVISINGLEEDLQNISQAIIEIKNDLLEYKLSVDQRLTDLENKFSSIT